MNDARHDMPATLEELEAELARQDLELDDARARFEETSSGARIEVPPSFYGDIAELCARRPRVTAPVPSGLRG